MEAAAAPLGPGRGPSARPRSAPRSPLPLAPPARREAAPAGQRSPAAAAAGSPPPAPAAAREGDAPTRPGQAPPALLRRLPPPSSACARPTPPPSRRARAPRACARAPVPALGVRRRPISARSRAPPSPPPHTPRRAPPFLPPTPPPPPGPAAQCCPPAARPGPAPLPPAARPGPARARGGPRAPHPRRRLRSRGHGSCRASPAGPAAPNHRAGPTGGCRARGRQQNGGVRTPRAPSPARPRALPRPLSAARSAPFPAAPPGTRPRPRGSGGRVLVGPRRAALPPAPPPAPGRPSPHTGGVPRAVVAAAPSLPPAEAGGSATSRAGPGAAPRHRTARLGTARGGGQQPGAARGCGTHRGGAARAACRRGARRGAALPAPPSLLPPAAALCFPAGQGLRGRSVLRFLPGAAGLRYGRASRSPAVTAGGHGREGGRTQPGPASGAAPRPAARRHRPAARRDHLGQPGGAPPPSPCRCATALTWPAWGTAPHRIAAPRPCHSRPRERLSLLPPAATCPAPRRHTPKIKAVVLFSTPPGAGRAPRGGAEQLRGFHGARMGPAPGWAPASFPLVVLGWGGRGGREGVAAGRAWCRCRGQSAWAPPAWPKPLSPIPVPHTALLPIQPAVVGLPPSLQTLFRPPRSRSAAQHSTAQSHGRLCVRTAGSLLRPIPAGLCPLPAAPARLPGGPWAPLHTQRCGVG